MKVTISRAILNQGRDTAISVKEQIEANDAKIEALPKVDPVMDGQLAFDKHTQTLAQLYEEVEKIISQGLTAVQDLRDRFDADLIDQETPKGDDLSNPDYILIRDNLIDTEAQLKALLEKHGNIAFARAAQNYADARGWVGFNEGVQDFRAVVGIARDMGEAYFHLCETAVSYPYGVAAMQIADEGEINRMAKEYGILEYLA